MKKFRINIWVLGVLLVSTLLHAQFQLSYTEYSVHAGGGTVAGLYQPQYIAAGTDDAVWFTVDVFDIPGQNCLIGRIDTKGAITEYPILTANSDVTGITLGPDGALWYTVGIWDRSGGKIGRITTGGVITEYPLPIAGSWPSHITSGPDGALWFSLSITNGGNMIGRISTTGDFLGYPIPANDGVPGSITTGFDRALWFTLVDGPGDNIGRLTTGGDLTVYRINTLPSGLANDITLGPDGALWFTEAHDGGNFIGRIITGGGVTQYPIPGPANAITFGGYGLWFTFLSGSSDPTLGLITTTGAVTTYPLHTVQPAGFNSIVAGPDGALWIADGAGWIGRAVISPAAALTLSAVGPPLGAPGSSYSTSLSASGGTPPYSHWTVSSGALPPSLALDAATGAITGIATTAGTFNFGVTFDDSTGTTSAEQIVSITIAPPNPGLNIVGSMPHLAAEENWTTTFTLINKTAVQSPARLSLYGDLDSGTLPLPLIFPQQPGGNPLLTASFEQNIAPNASLIVQTAGPQTGPVKVGSAQVATTGAIDGFAIFHHVLTGQETVVPLEGPGAASYLLAFDNSGGNVLGIALANPLAKDQNIGVGISDDSGTFIEADSLIIPANGHISFVLPALYPVTANLRGTITFYAFQGGQQFGALGMRFAAPNNALTTIPGLTGGQAGVSSIAHVASGNGWKTTFVLVNFNQIDGVGQPSPFQLNFFDDNGNPLALPVGISANRERHQRGDHFRSADVGAQRDADHRKRRAANQPRAHRRLGSALHKWFSGRLRHVPLRTERPGSGGAARKPQGRRLPVGFRQYRRNRHRRCGQQRFIAAGRRTRNHSRRRGESAGHRHAAPGCQRTRRLHARHRQVSDDRQHSRDHRIRHALWRADRGARVPHSGGPHLYHPAVASGSWNLRADFTGLPLAGRAARLVRGVFLVLQTVVLQQIRIRQ